MHTYLAPDMKSREQVEGRAGQSVDARQRHHVNGAAAAPCGDLIEDFATVRPRNRHYAKPVI